MVFKYENDNRYKSSFEFIKKQLLQFQDYLLNIPGRAQESVAIEVKYIKEEHLFYKNLLKVFSVKHEVHELFELENNQNWGISTVSCFKILLRKTLCVPSNKLTICTNMPEVSELQELQAPERNLKLLK